MNMAAYFEAIAIIEDPEEKCCWWYGMNWMVR
jgi:hypothetical protein